MIITGKDISIKPGDRVKIKVKDKARLQLRKIKDVDEVFKTILITLLGKDEWIKAYQIVSHYES